MSQIFDSSSIFKAIKENKIETLAGNYTLELTRYELGNILWKELTLHKHLNKKETTTLIEVIKKVLNLMETLSIKCHEKEILTIAQKLKLTFYDASYIYHAKNKKSPLITEDKHLIAKTKQHIQTLTLDNLHHNIQQSSRQTMF
jgi:predicted nucleic acid-binding protein